MENIITKPLTLEPNTKYVISFLYSYQTEDENCYVSTLDYGIYNLDNIENIGVRGQSVGKGAYTKKANTYFVTPNTKRKLTLEFETPENTENLVFVLRYSDENVLGKEKGKTTLFIDDFKLYLAAEVPKSKVKIKCKTCASVNLITTNPDNIFVGDKLELTVTTANGRSSLVKVNSNTIVPNENGIHSFVAEEKVDIEVSCKGDETLSYANVDKFGNNLAKYNEDIAALPIWEGDTVYHETVLFFGNRKTAKLLYPISEIISVRSYDLYTNYLEGVDYEITKDGLLKILDGSRIPIYKKPLECHNTKENPLPEIIKAFPIVGKENTYASFIDDYVYPAYAINVTYEHNKLWEDGFNPYIIQSVKKDIPKVFEKLEKGEDVNVVIFGDSASCGWSSSGLNYVEGIYSPDNASFMSYMLNFPPFTPPWTIMLEQGLKKLYPKANVTFKNLALGGKCANWGYANVAKRLNLLGDDWKSDLVILAFGGNDLTRGDSTDLFYSNMQKNIDAIRLETTNGAGPDTEILLWSQYICNTKVKQYTLDKHLAYRDVYFELAKANDNVGLVDTVGEFNEVLKSKDVVDIFNTNVNHGNDFLTRVIAQCMLSAFNPKNDK